MLSFAIKTEACTNPGFYCWEPRRSFRITNRRGDISETVTAYYPSDKNTENIL